MKHLISLILFLLGTQLLLANRIEVCKDCPVSSIKEGIRRALPCDTIVVLKGVYVEGNLTIDKGLTLIGIDFPVLDGEDKSELITITADWVTITGFQLENVGISHMVDQAAIRIIESRDFSIVNNRLINTYFGIYLQNASEGELLNNHIEGTAKSEATSGNGIHLWYCERVIIRNNFISGHRDGIYFEFVDKSEITGNQSEKNIRYGLHFMFSNDNNYIQNIFRNNGAGVAVMYSKRINMYNNLFEQNWGASSYGLLLKEIHDSHIVNNRFHKNTIAIFAETSNRLSLLKNVFSQNGWALKISGGCQQFILSQNDFLSNSFDLAVHSAGDDNSFDGNFWGDYSGYDLDRNGVGDVPHRPMKLFSYIISRTPEAIVLLRSLFVDILNFSEKVSPIFTPENVVDNTPLMRPVFVP